MEEQTEINKSEEVSQVKRTSLWNRAKKYFKLRELAFGTEKLMLKIWLHHLFSV